MPWLEYNSTTGMTLTRLRSLSPTDAVAHIILIIVSIAAFSLVALRWESLSGVILLGILSLAFVSAVVLIGYDQIKIRGMELIRNQGTDGDEEGFDQVLSIAEDESPRTRDLLESIQSHNVSASPFDELANVIEAGLYARETTPVERSIDMIKLIIDTKNYKQQFSNTELKVVDLRSDTLHVKSGNRGEFLKEGMKFKLITTRQSVSGDEVEDVSDPIAIAEVELASRTTTKMRILRWNVSTNRDDVKDIRNNELEGKRVSVELLTPDGIEEVNIEELAEIRNELSTTSMVPELEDND